MFRKNFDQLRQKIKLLKENDKHFTIFGSETHHYELTPVLSKKDIEKFERKLKIKLPSEYCLFLQKIGASGVGPYYGLHNFNYLEKELDKDSLSKPFIPSPNYQHIIKLSKERPPNDPHLTSIYYPAPGVLPLCTMGCTYHQGIVLHGKERGNIWEYVEFGWVPVINKTIPLFDEKNEIVKIDPETCDYETLNRYFDYLLGTQNRKNRFGFYDWYNQWLDKSLEEIVYKKIL